MRLGKEEDCPEAGMISLEMISSLSQRVQCRLYGGKQQTKGLHTLKKSCLKNREDVMAVGIEIHL